MLSIPKNKHFQPTEPTPAEFGNTNPDTPEDADLLATGEWDHLPNDEPGDDDTSKLPGD